ncbi:MAG: hypothetical protein ACJ8GL_07070, partial [Bacillus sp. (in: firmicutes)]
MTKAAFNTKINRKNKLYFASLNYFKSRYIATFDRLIILINLNSTKSKGVLFLLKVLSKSAFALALAGS